MTLEATQPTRKTNGQKLVEERSKAKTIYNSMIIRMDVQLLIIMNCRAISTAIYVIVGSLFVISVQLRNRVCVSESISDCI